MLTPASYTMLRKAYQTRGSSAVCADHDRVTGMMPSPLFMTMGDPRS